MDIGQADDMEEPTTIPFGKYKGEQITEIPDEYLEWLLDQDWFKDKFKSHYDTITAELTTRQEQGTEIIEEKEEDFPY